MGGCVAAIVGFGMLPWNDVQEKQLLHLDQLSVPESSRLVADVIVRLDTPPPHSPPFSSDTT